MDSIAGDGRRGPRATVRRDRLREAPYSTWSAFVELMSSADYDELTALQRVAFLAFRYDAEVKNGGHARYFRHHGLTRLAETATALTRLGAEPHREVLEAAAGLWQAGGTAEMDRMDDEFHSRQPDLHVRLEAWLEAHTAEFIVFEG